MGWQDKAQKVQTSPGGWQGRAQRVQPPAAPPPAAARTSAPKEQYGPPVAADEGSTFGRKAQIVGQGIGAGVADLAGAPSDMGQLYQMAGMRLLNAAISAFGGPDLSNTVAATDAEAPFMGSEHIRDKSADAVTSVLGDSAVIPVEDMSSPERILRGIAEFGANAAAGSGLVRAGKDVLPRVLTAPYRAAGNPTRVLLGDVAAGMGSGALMNTYREYAPQPVQDALGPVGDLITALAGGVGGSTLASLGEKAWQKAIRAPDAYRTIPESIVPVDPETMLPATRADFSRAASLVQNQAFDPQAAAAEIAAYLDAAGSGAHPTSGLISADPGLAVVDRQLRASDPRDFIAQDQAVMGAASDAVSATRPPNGDPYAPDAFATREIDKKLGGPRAHVTARADAVAQADSALMQQADAFSGVRSADQASRDLDRAIVGDTYLLDRALKNRLYNTAAAVPNVVVRTDNVNSAAEAVLAAASALNPALRDAKTMELAQAFRTPGTRKLSELIGDRAALGWIKADARGAFATADTAAALRRGINADVRSAAESGASGTESLAIADAFYRNDFAPTYREGSVAPDFFRAVDRDPSRGSTPPEATAGRFLISGPFSRAAAEDLSRVIARAPDPAAAKSAATDYVLSDAVRAGVIQNGKISETRLARFMAAREGMLSQVPEIKAKFDDLLAGVRSGNAQVQQLTADLKAASEALKLTEADINKGALKIVAGSDPGVAVGRIFSDRNPAERMKEATAAFAVDPETAAGWKAAVSDWLVENVTTSSKAGVSAGGSTVSLPALRRTFKQNERALAEVFSPEEMQLLQQAYTRLEVMTRKGTQAVSGSATAETQRGLRGLISTLAGPVGTVVSVTKGVLTGGSVDRRMRLVAEQFPDADKAATRLIRRAMFDPRIMKHMLEFPTSDAQIYTWSAKLNQLLAVQEAATGGEDK